MTNEVGMILFGASILYIIIYVVGSVKSTVDGTKSDK